MDNPGEKTVEGRVADMETLPKCGKCQQDFAMVPLSDYFYDGSKQNTHVAEVRYKAWVCTNPKCGFTIKVSGGKTFYTTTRQEER